jgi:hypothetical protein
VPACGPAAALAEGGLEMLPLSDGIPARRFPIVNVFLIVANFAVWIFYELPQQPAKADARGGDVRRASIGYSQSCYNSSAVMISSLRWMLSNDRQAAAVVGLDRPAWPLRGQVDSRRRSDGRGGTGSRCPEGVAAGPA